MKFGPPIKRLMTRRWAKYLAGGLVTLAVCALALWLGVPPLLRWGIESQASLALGRTVHVGQVSFNPFNLTARVEGLRVDAAQAKEAPLVSIDALSVNVSSASIWYRGLVLDGLQITRPKINIARLGAGRYNFSDIIDRLNAQPADPKGKPFLFSVNNIILTEGELLFDDQPVGKHHRIDQLKLGIPFISNLPARGQIAVVPHLMARVNGSDFRLEGELKPFAASPEAKLAIKLAPFDLTQYLGYAPAPLPVQIKQGAAQCDIQLVWRQAAGQAQRFDLFGSVGLQDLRMQDAEQAPLFALKRLDVGIESLEPLQTPLKARLAYIKLNAPELNVTRLSDGSLNLARLGAKEDVANVATPALAPALAVKHIEVTQATVRWQDRAVAGGYALALTPISLKLDGFDLAGKKPAKLAVQAQGERDLHLALDGLVLPEENGFKGRVSLSGLGLADLRPYYQSAIGPGLIAGQASADLDLHVATRPQFQLQFSEAKLGLNDLAVTDPVSHKTAASITQIQAEGIQADLAERALQVARFTMGKARWSVVKNQQGQIDLLKLLLPKSPAPNTSNTQSASSSFSAQGDWKLALSEARLADWDVHFEDRSGANPVNFDVHDLGIQVTNWSNASAHPADIALKARANRAGKVDIAGKVSTQPLKGTLKLDVRDVDLLAIQPYVDQYFKILVTRGRLSARGNAEFDFAQAAAPQVRYQGGLAVDEFSSLDQLNDADFLQWRHFGVEGANFQLRPLSLSAAKVSLDSFYSRLILDAQGRFNLRELTAEQEGDKPKAPASSAASNPFQIRIDKVQLSGGSINYSDRFVRPNYDAKVAALSGTLVGLSSDPGSLAQLDLKGAVDGTAPMQVSGQLNPLRQDKFLDIQAQVKGVDLTSVSTYSAKYVGYGIEKGKLSMDLKYQIRDRKLTAQNQIFLDQLTFGDKVDSPDATKLPVLFAVSLLKNSRGEINVNLPVSGSLDDPQFSVGGIVVRLLINVVTKAVSAPFKLIGSMFGHGDDEELSYVSFAPGQSDLNAATLAKLKTLAKALVDRPALKLEIAGQTDPSADLDGVNRARLAERMRALKAEHLVKAGQSVADVDMVTIEPAEYPKLLEEVYGNEKVADKPRNALGMAKVLPVEEMEKLLLRHFSKQAPDLQLLAAQRAKAVRDWLVEEGHVEPDRLFLLSTAQTGSPAETKAAGPSVVFALK